MVLEKVAEDSWTDAFRNEEVLHRVRYRKTLHTVKRRKGNLTGPILPRNCLLNWKDENDGRRGRRRKQLIDDLKEKRGYWK